MSQELFRKKVKKSLKEEKNISIKLEKNLKLLHKNMAQLQEQLKQLKTHQK